MASNAKITHVWNKYGNCSCEAVKMWFDEPDQLDLSVAAVAL